MLTGRFLLGRGRDQMTEAEKQALEDAVSCVKAHSGRVQLYRAGERVEHSTMLLEGQMGRYMDSRDGERQLVSIHVPGDFVDLHGFPMHRLDHDIATLGPAKVALFDHRRLTELTEAMPRLARLLWFSTLLDAAIHREWIFRLGRLNAEGRVAHFMSELDERMAMVGLADGGQFDTSLIQADIAEACGVTTVHVNRVLRTLREQGLLSFRQGIVTIADRGGLAQLGEFDPDYLYGDHSALALSRERSDQ